MPLRILVGSAFDSGTLAQTSGGAVSGYPASNILTAMRSEFTVSSAFSDGAGNWVTRYEITNAANTSVNCVVAARTSLRSTGTFNARLYNSSGTELANVLGVTVPGGDGSLDLLTDGSARSVNNAAMWFSSSFKFTRKVALEMTSTDNQHELGRMMAGVYRELDWNFDWGYTLTWSDPAVTSTTYGGDQIVTYNGPPKRRLDLPFNGLRAADQRYLFDLVRVAGKSRELFISAWPSESTNPALEAQCQMWCRIVETRGFTNPSTGYFGTGIVFEEL